jgi:hypothetical protein
VKLLSTDEKVEVREFVEKVSAPILCHATHYPEKEVWVLDFALAEVASLTNSLLLGLIPDATGVEENGVGFVFVFDN